MPAMKTNFGPCGPAPIQMPDAPVRRREAAMTAKSPTSRIGMRPGT